MRKIFIITTLLPALLACNPPLFDQSSREQPDSGRTPPPSLRDTTQKEPDIYVTAVMFPDSVNWRKGGTAERGRSESIHKMPVGNSDGEDAAESAEEA